MRLLGSPLGKMPGHEEQLQYLVDVVQRLSLVRTIEDVMKIVRTAARNLCGADGASFVLRDQDSCYYADEDAISPLWKGSRFPLSTCISGWAMLNKKNVVIPDIYSDERIPVAAYEPTFVKSLVMVPIRTVDPIGAIGVYWSSWHKAPQREVEILQSLADITAVAMENERIYRELEDRVKERTYELEIANKQIEAFSYSVSHDLRSPLAGIIGLADVLKDQYGHLMNNDGKEMVDLIMQTASDMGLLIEDLLLFFMAGNNTLQVEEVAMKDMAFNAFQILKKEESGNRAIRLEIEDLPGILGDASLLKHVWVNLLGNAIKYSRKKNETIISVGFEETDTAVTFFVKDNGDGFDMKHYQKLFTPFQRLHSDKEFNGTGIGLSIVEKIITRCGGKLWADATPGEGAVFYFSLDKHLA